MLYSVTMVTDGTVDSIAEISYNGALYTNVDVSSGTYTIITTDPSGYIFKQWQITAGYATITNTSAASTIIRIIGYPVTIKATYVPLYRVTMITDGTVGSYAEISYNGTLYTSANVPDRTYNIIATVPSDYSFSQWQITAGAGFIDTASAASTALIVNGSAVTVKATYNRKLYNVTMVTDGSLGSTAKINYNGTLVTSADVSSGTYGIIASVPPAYTFDGWSITSGSGFITNISEPSTTLVVTESVRVKACYIDPSLCPTLPVFTPVACGIAQSREYPNPTSRAALKASKSASIFSGQAQSTRIGALKRCIAQVNASEIGFNQVNRRNVTVCDTITYQSPVTEYRDVQLAPPVFNAFFSNQRQPDLNITTVDPTGKIYALTNYVSGSQNRLTVTRFTASSGSLNIDLSGEELILSGTLVSANLFWRNDILVFVGIFYGTRTSVQLYTYDTSLSATLAPIQFPTISNTKRYTGQSTYNSAGYIYIALAAPSTGGYESTTLYYIAPELAGAPLVTNIQVDYSSIQQMIGDTNRGAILAAPVVNQMYLVYISNSIYFWRQLLFEGPLCAVAVNGTSILTLGYDGTNILSQSITYVPNTPSYTLNRTIIVPMTWPNGIQYTVRAITLCTSPTAQRYFYIMNLYNPEITNFEYYVQIGEITFDGTIVGTPVNIQINSEYKIAPTNTIQASANYLAAASGLQLATYAITYKQEYQGLITLTRDRKYCITEIIYPGCDCPTVPVNNTPPLDGLTRTLNLAICQPIRFSNPALSDGCGPVYTAPTQYLTEASGAEPPQGPAVKTIVRKYDRINGIDEICKPIPGRYGSSRTARIRSNIEAASATRYVTTVLPQVPYPFPCPVYGNQTGIPRASLCQPSIDARPTNGIPS